MKKKKIMWMLGAVLTAACLAMGCSGGSSGQNTTQTNAAETSASQDDAAQTEAPLTDAQETDALQITDDADDMPVEVPDDGSTSVEPEEPAQDETVADNPVAEVGEGSTNSFKDDAGNWITVTMNADGQWVDESGMAYTFGDDGVTDSNGNFYPY